MEVEHNGIKIEYNENINNWTFTLRNRERKAESLAKAKEFIDRPVAANSKDDDSFPRTKCYVQNHGWRSERGEGRWMVVDATSLTTRRYSGSIEAYTSRNGKVDGKRYISDLYPVGEKNDPLVKESEELTKQINALEAKRNKVEDKMVELKVKEPTE